MTSVEMELQEGLSRRNFIKGGAFVGAAALGGAALGSTALTGCSSNGSTSSSSATTSAGSEDLGEAAPIEPLTPPSEWSGEADLVIVGTGGGGLAAAVLACEKGASVIVVEKDPTWGGATKFAGHYLNGPGGSKMQDELGFAWPSFPYNRDAFVRDVMPNYQFAIDQHLLGNVADYGGKVADWMTELGVPWVCVGESYTPVAVLTGQQTSILGFKTICDHMYNLAVEGGAEFHFDTPCEGLVVENNAVVGIMAKSTSGEELYFKGKKGVVLCSGGIGMNWDMMKKYIPTAYERAVHGGPMPQHTGECTRMALGVGADMSGLDSWAAWESAPDNGSRDWQFFWGNRQLLQVPWLNIDCRGVRTEFFDSLELPGKETAQPNLPHITGIGEHLVGAIQMSQQGARTYAIFDADYEQYMDKLGMNPGSERRPLRKDEPHLETDLVDPDYVTLLEEAVENDYVIKADTLDDLAAGLGLDTDVVKDAVEHWNDLCEKGEDTDLVWPYNPGWLSPVQTPPYYGAKIGGCIGKTLAGLRVDPELRVINTEGKVIPGLYANFTTAGGIYGESSYGGSLYNTSILGGNGLTWATGYLAAETALNN